MPVKWKASSRVLAALCLAAVAAAALRAQDYETLDAKLRLFPGIGVGLRAVKRGANGNYYVLASPAPGLSVFNAEGKSILQIGAPPAASEVKTAALPAIVYGEDCDVDAEGRIYIADRGANQLMILTPAGQLLRSIPVQAPVSVAALSGGEIAVSTLRSPRLVTVFDVSGREVREFGDPADIAQRPELNRVLNIGRIVSDGRDHLYFGFNYLPEATVRQYDRQGYGGNEIQLTGLDFLAGAQAVRREIERQESRGDTPSFKKVLTALGVEPATGEVWVALGNTLVHFDREGNRRATYKLYTPDGARLEANTILVEAERLVMGSDPLGVYEFERPDKKTVN